MSDLSVEIGNCGLCANGTLVWYSVTVSSHTNTKSHVQSLGSFITIDHS